MNADIHRKGTLRGKLMTTVVLTALAGILFSSTTLFAYQLWSLRRQFRVEMSALARIVSDYLVAPVSFGDSSGMQDALAVLQSRPEIVRAELRQNDGTVLAHFGRSESDHEPWASPGFHGFHLQVAQQLVLLDEHLGELRIEATWRPVILSAVKSFIPALLAMIVFSGIGLALFTRYRVHSLLGGLDSLTSSANRIASTGDYTVRPPVQSQDEIGTLTATFNHMLDQLQATDQTLRRLNQTLNTEIAERKRLERALVDSSRVAGMAEVATGVLHNVGNVLNSINVSAQLLRERVETSQLQGLHEVAEIVRPHLADPKDFFSSDARAPLLLQFVHELSDQLKVEQKLELQELQLLARNVEHVKEVVAAQQSFARTSGVLEPVDLAGLMEDALRINGSSLANHRIIVRRNFAPDATVETDRHRTLQILVNLVSNAIHAVKHNPFEDRRVDLEIRADEAGFKLVVQDSGVGIAPEHLTRIFQHGFTTRKEGHGFGLHSGAIAARTLGGSLSAESEGLKCGARFTLFIPRPVQPASQPVPSPEVPGAAVSVA